MRSKTRTQSFTGQFLYGRDRQSKSAEKMFGDEREGVCKIDILCIQHFSVKTCAHGRNRALCGRSRLCGFYFLPDEDFPVVEMRGRGAVKQSIAQEVTSKLKLKLSSEEQRRLVKRDSINPEAYQFYLRGRYFGTSALRTGSNKRSSSSSRASSATLILLSATSAWRIPT